MIKKLKLNQIIKLLIFFYFDTFPPFTNRYSPLSGMIVSERRPEPVVPQLAHQLGLTGPTALPPVMEEHRPGLTGTVNPTGNRKF